jgi:hypothetical protein
MNEMRLKVEIFLKQIKIVSCHELKFFMLEGRLLKTLIPK